MRFRFAEFETDAARFELIRDGLPVPIEPKPLRLLLHLLLRHPATCSKEELLEALWPAERVTADSLTRAVGVARRALGDSGAYPRLICTVRGHGYRIGVDVERIPDGSAVRGKGGPDVFVGRHEVLDELREGFARASARPRRCRVADG